MSRSPRNVSRAAHLATVTTETCHAAAALVAFAGIATMLGADAAPLASLAWLGLAVVLIAIGHSCGRLRDRHRN